MASVRAFLTFAFCLLPFAFVPAAQQQSQAPPPFRAGVDVFEFEVSVLDRNRQPVRGLKVGDFTVLESGRPQPIVGFSEVEFPGYDGPLTTAVEDVAPDVSSTRYADRRLIAVVMDDFGMPESPGANLQMTLQAKVVGKFIVDRLGPKDFAAVVLTRDTRYVPDFSNDRWKLFGYVNEFKPPAGAEKAYLYWVTRGHIGGLVALADVAQSLGRLPQHRKMIFYVSIGQGVGFGGVGHDRMTEAIRLAREAGVPIYPIDPQGLVVSGPGNTDLLRTLAENTGGSAVVDNNDFHDRVLQVYGETQSYYLIGYQQTGPSDGKFRRIEVRLNRPGLTAYTRSGRYAPGAPDMVKPPPLPVDEEVDAAVEALGRAANRRLATYAAIGPGTIDLVAEVGLVEAANVRWARGAAVEARVTRGPGDLVTTATGRMEPGDRSARLRIAVPDAGATPDNGARDPLHVSVRVSADGATVEGGSDAVALGPLLGAPIVLRARSAASAPFKPAAELQFSRTERMRVELPVQRPLTERHTRLLRRNGQTLVEPPPEIVEQVVGGRTILSSEVGLSFLAPGDYVFELFVRAGDQAERRLVAFAVK